jgi:PAS domain S-box-containing protein
MHGAGVIQRAIKAVFSTAKVGHVARATKRWQENEIARLRQALAASQSSLARLESLASLGSWVWNVEQGVLNGSPEAYRIFGLPEGLHDVKLAELIERIHPDDRAAVNAALERTRIFGTAYDIGFRIIAPGGHVRTVHSRGELDSASSAEEVRIIGSLQDITERVAATKALEDSERFHKSILDSMFAFSCVLTTDGVVAEINRAPLDSAGISREEVVGKPFRETYWWSHELASQDELGDALSRAAAGETVRRDFVVRIAENSFAPIDATFGPLRDSSGNIVSLVASGVGITERKRAEAAAAEREAVLSVILAAVPECIKRLDDQCRLLDMNRAGMDMIEAESFEVVRGKSVLDLIVADYHEEYRQGVAAVFRGEITCQQFEIVSLTGTRRWMEQISSPLYARDGSGKVVEMLAVTRDVTERQRVQQAVRQSHHRLEEAQRIGNMGSWEWEIATNKLIWSDQIYRIFGLIPQEFTASLPAFLDRVHQGDRDFVKAAVKEALAEQKAYDVHHRIVLPSGEVRFVHGKGEGELDQNGKVVRLSGTVRDVTEAIVTQEALRRSEAMLSGIFKMSPEAVILTDHDLRITLFSSGAEEIFGYRREEIVGKHIECLIPEQFRSAHANHVRRFAAGAGSGKRMQERSAISGMRRNGEVFPAEASISKLETADDFVYTLILRDITTQKSALEAMTNAKLKAEEANEAKSRFLAAMSHELRTPLNAIIGFSSVISDEMFGPVSHKKYVEYARDIRHSGEHLLNLINDVLDMARIESGKIVLHEEQIALEDVIEPAIRMVRPRAESAQLRLGTQLNSAQKVLFVDQRLLLQAVVNLLANAVKFTPHEGVVEVIVEDDSDGGIAISVRDTGIGIVEEDLKRLGEPFVQIDNRISRKFEGAGLGLSIAKQIVQLHGGRLSIESVPQKGTTVRIRLPANRVVRQSGARAVA